MKIFGVLRGKRSRTVMIKKARNYDAYLVADNEWKADYELANDIRWCKDRCEDKHCHDDVSSIFFQGIYLNES